MRTQKEESIARKQENETGTGTKAVTTDVNMEIYSTKMVVSLGIEKSKDMREKFKRRFWILGKLCN